MNYLIAFRLPAAILAAGLAFAADTAVTPKKATVLFNGRNLDNFYTWLEHSKYQDPKKVFSVVQGLLRISGEEWGGIGTRQTYRDYHLVCEWKWGGKTYPPREDRARDSGILVHGIGEDGAYNDKWLQSYEHQIIEGGCGDFIMVGGKGRPSLTVETRKAGTGQLHWQRGGTPVTLDRGRFNWFGRDEMWKDVLGFRGAQEVEKPMGEWNISETICDGDKITNIVNGVTVNEGRGASQTEGKIMLQSEGAEIYFRKIELRPLKRK